MPPRLRTGCSGSNRNSAAPDSAANSVAASRSDGCGAVHDKVEITEGCQGPDGFQATTECRERSPAERLVRRPNTIHADPHEVHAPGQGGDESIGEVVRMGGEGHGQPRMPGSVPAQLRKAAVESRLASSESDAAASIRVEFVDQFTTRSNCRVAGFFGA